MVESKAICPYCEYNIPFDVLDERWMNQNDIWFKYKCLCKKFIGISINLHGDFISFKLKKDYVMAYKTHIQSIGSTKGAGVGFLPVPGPVIFDSVVPDIHTPNASTVITVRDFVASGIRVVMNISTNIPTGINTEYSAPNDMTGAQFAVGFGADIDSNDNLSAIVVGNVITITPIDSASEFTIDYLEIYKS